MNIGLVVALQVGVLFILLGILMPLLRQNTFIGIRTPWTLTSQLSWRKTHRLSGVLFALAGLLIIVLELVTKLPALAIVLPVILLTSAVVIIYSYFVWRDDPNRENRGLLQGVGDSECGFDN